MASTGVTAEKGNTARPAKAIKAAGHQSEPRDEPDNGGESRAVVTLSPQAAAAARRLATQMGGVNLAEVVRRGLMLLDLKVNLDPDEELAIRNRQSQEVQRLRLVWDFDR
jgi:hypothetical protein